MEVRIRARGYFGVSNIIVHDLGCCGLMHTLSQDRNYGTSYHWTLLRQSSSVTVFKTKLKTYLF